MKVATELHIKYRPQTFDAVLGNKAVVAAIRDALKNGRSRSFLLVGPPGTGKTTLARLIAGDSSYSEYDGALHTGVEDVRDIVRQARLRPLGSKSGGNTLIIDECHYLSKNAWNALLKVVEEPPPGVVWVFCTSEGAKVPAAVRSRCQEYNLKLLADELVADLVQNVAKREGIRLSHEVLALVVEAAAGVPRNALVGLGKVASNPTDTRSARSVLSSIGDEESGEVIDFCRMMMAGESDFRRLAAKVLSLQGKISAEGVRNVVNAYFAKACTSNQWERAAAILTGFAAPYPAGNGDSMSPVLVSLASVLDRG